MKNGRFCSIVRLAPGILFTAILPFAFERLAQYYFLAHSPAFFTFSGARYYFDVAYLALAGGLLGYRFGTLRALATYIPSVFVLVALFFIACDPLLCYSTGADGLEPLRMGSFFTAEGVAIAYLGDRGRNESRDRPLEFLGSACGFYAVAYNPVIFTLAGARILAPFDPYGTLILLGAMSAIIATKLSHEAGTTKRVLLPIASQVALLLVGVGVTWQYFWDVSQFIGWSVLAAAAGALAGAAILQRRRRVDAATNRLSRPLFAGIVLFVFLTTLVVWPDAVAGQVSSSSNPNLPASYSSRIPLYVGGFMSSPMVRPTAIALNVSFADSDRSSLSPGNFLGAGIGVHSADCCTDGIDYGYRFDLLLWRNGSEEFASSAWRICDANAACGGHSWKVLLYHLLTPYRGSSLAQPVRLVMLWQNRTVVWQYVSGSETVRVGSMEASSRMNAAFNSGWLGPPDKPSPGGAFFFQFGITTLRPLDHRWTVTLACPSIFLDGRWSCIDHAQSLQGDQSYWKVLWRWGENFQNVRTTINRADRAVIFGNSTSTVGSFVEFW